MAKFYVQSGTVRGVVDSEDADRAALWAVHIVMERVVPLDGDDSFRKTVSKNDLRLGEAIRISEIGFDREDAQSIDSFEAFRHWFELVQAVDKLQSLLS